MHRENHLSTIPEANIYSLPPRKINRAPGLAAVQTPARSVSSSIVPASQAAVSVEYFRHLQIAGLSANILESRPTDKKGNP